MLNRRKILAQFKIVWEMMCVVPVPSTASIRHAVKAELLRSAKVVGKSQVMLLFKLTAAAAPKGNK